MAANFIYDSKTNTIVTEDKSSFPVTENFTFQIGDVDYTLYNFTTTLVKHEKCGFGDMSYRYFDHMLAMETSKIIECVGDLANVTQYQLSIQVDNKTLGTKDTLINTLEKIKNNILYCINNENLQINPEMKHVIDFLISHIKDYNPQNMINNLPHTTKISRNYPLNTPPREMLSDLIRYVCYHNTFHENLVNNRGLTCFPDTIFLLTVINVLMNSITVTIPPMNLTSLQDLLIHHVIETAYNIGMMKLDRELFIHERNDTAKEIKKLFYSTFPILGKAVSVQEKLQAITRNPKYEKLLSEQPVQMDPYILMYTLSDKQRVKLCYSEFMKNKSVIENLNQKINWMDPDKFIQTMQHFSEKHSHSYSRYDKDLFTTVITQFLTVDTTQVVEEQMDIS